MTDYGSLEFNQFSTQALKKYNIDLKSFDKNNNNKIDGNELSNILSGCKVSSVGQLLTKEGIKEKIKNIEKELSDIKNNSLKYFIGSGMIGSICGVGATGLSGIATVLSTTAAVSTCGVAALILGAAGCMTMKAMLNDKQKSLEAELNFYQQALKQQA